MRAEQVTAPAAQHGEGPVWLSGSAWPDGLSWVDMLVGDVLSLTTNGEVERRHVADVVAMVRPRTNGGLVYAVERGFALDDGPRTEVRALPTLWGDRGVRMNDGGCDPAGYLYCGSMAYDASPGAGAFHRLAPDGTVSLISDGWTIPNGLEWAPDGRVAYHVDTTARRIDRWSWDEQAGLHDRRPFVEVDGDGDPDGLTVDAEGGVWVALWGGSCVRRYDSGGSLSAVLEVPVSQVSSCAFGGPDRDHLFVTTSRHGLADPEPAAGAVFMVSAGVSGVPVRPYAG